MGFQRQASEPSTDSGSIIEKKKNNSSVELSAEFGTHFNLCKCVVDKYLSLLVCNNSGIYRMASCEDGMDLLVVVDYALCGNGDLEFLSVPL